MSRFSFIGVALLATAAIATAQEATDSQQSAEPITATYLITGLHCPPCTRTVESSLRRVEGIQSVKVDWRTKNARVEFDESVLPAQKVAQLIAGTRHMMGSNMQYGGWLALDVPELKDDASANEVKEVLSKVTGVKRVVAYPARHSVGIAFDADGELTSQELIEALGDAGIKAKNF